MPMMPTGNDAWFIYIKRTCLIDHQRPKIMHLTWRFKKNKTKGCGKAKPKGVVQQDTNWAQHTEHSSQVCKAAGVTGYKTNNLLRVTTATRLFQKEVEEHAANYVTNWTQVWKVNEHTKELETAKDKWCWTFSMKPPMLKKKHLPVREWKLYYLHQPNHQHTFPPLQTL